MPASGGGVEAEKRPSGLCGGLVGVRGTDGGRLFGVVHRQPVGNRTGTGAVFRAAAI